MVEQKQKKIRGIFRRIFKWISLGLLITLLILALIFQAPWKISVFLIIFLAACTVLPKRFREWFWLGVGAVVIALIVWVFLPENNEGWRPYTFDEELAAFEAEYAIPDEENAAFAYDTILETLDIFSNQPEFFVRSKPSSKNAPWQSRDHPQTAEWLKGHRNTIAKLMQAARKDKCHFPIPAYTWDGDQYMERLAPLRQCASLLVSSANNDVGDGRIDAGLEKYHCLVQMADHLYQQPMVIVFLVGTAVEHLALTQFNKFVIEGEPTSEQLQIISGFVKNLENNWGPEFKKFIESTKLRTKNTYCSQAFEVNPKGKIRPSRDPIALIRAAYPKVLPAQTYWNRRFYRAKAILAWFSVPSTPQTIAEIIDASYDKLDTMYEPDYDRTKETPTFNPDLMKTIIARLRFNDKYLYQCLAQFSVELLKETYFKLHDTYMKSLTLRRGSRVLVAMKQYQNEHGTWPPNLDAIKTTAPAEAFIDPITGNPLQYENLGERFSLKTETVNIWPK